MKRGAECATCAGYRANSAEMKIRRWLEEDSVLSKFPPKHRDQIIDAKCGRERPDFYWETKHGVLILEIDEREHEDRRVNCEVTREFNLAEQFGESIVFIRFNPDAYKPFGTTVRISWESRLMSLKSYLLRCLQREKSEKPEIIFKYIYYSPLQKKLLKDERERVCKDFPDLLQIVKYE